MPKSMVKKRFSVGRRVLVGMGMRPGTVTFVDEYPSTLAEYRHGVQLDGEEEVRNVLGCEIQGVPPLDQDLNRSNRSVVNLQIQHSNVANLNLGSQIGTINSALESMSKEGGDQQDLVQALKQITEAVVSQRALPDAEKQDIVDALTTVAEQAAKKPEERSNGTLKAVAKWLPTAITGVSELTKLWETVSPIIRSHLNI
jgi:hypothetical protein